MVGWLSELFFPVLLSGSRENNKEWFICLNVSKLDKEYTDCGINIANKQTLLKLWWSQQPHFAAPQTYASDFLGGL